MTRDNSTSSEDHSVPSDSKPVVYTAMPKYLAIMDPFIGAFVYNNDGVPITPWMYPFWLLDQVDRGAVRNGNAAYIDAADEVWVFATETGIFNDAVETLFGLAIHDGVLREIEQAAKLDTPVKFYHLDHDTQDITLVGEVTDHDKAIPATSQDLPDHVSTPV